MYNIQADSGCTLSYKDLFCIMVDGHLFWSKALGALGNSAIMLYALTLWELLRIICANFFWSETVPFPVLTEGFM